MNSIGAPGAAMQRLFSIHDMQPTDNSTPAAWTPSQLEALVRLLADESEPIRRVANSRLREAGAAALEIARECASRTEDVQVREAATVFLRESGRSRVVARWEAFAGGAEVDLEAGAILIAAAEYPDLDPEHCRAQIEDFATVLRRRLLAIRSPSAAVERINGLLFGELGFRGNRESYYDPRNSYINQVIERRLGIPISLSVLYLLVARRLGQPLDGVGMPGHFLLRFREGRCETFLDPFNRGSIWSHQDCVAHLRNEGYGFREEYLRAVSDREILARILANLLSIYHSTQDEERTERISHMLAGLRVESVPPGSA